MAEKLVDSYKREIDYLRLSVTDRCNLRCIYCMPEGGIKIINRKELLTFEEIIRVTRILSCLGIKKIRITGGEPLLRGDIIRLIGGIGKTNGIEDLSLTTNGTLLSKYAEPLYRAGIKRINVSIDSLDPQKFRAITRGGDLKQVLDGVSKAVVTGFEPVKINVVITNLLDKKDILDFVKLTVENFISVRFIESMPVVDLNNVECGKIGIIKRDAGLNKNLSGGYSIYKVLSIVKKNWSLCKTDGPVGYGPSEYYKIKGSRGTVGFIFNDKAHCRRCNRIRLTPKGSIKLCLFSSCEFDIKAEIRSGVSDVDIKKKLVDFIKTKPENRGTNNDCKSCGSMKIPDYMYQVGG